MDSEKAESHCTQSITKYITKLPSESKEYHKCESFCISCRAMEIIQHISKVWLLSAHDLDFLHKIQKFHENINTNLENPKKSIETHENLMDFYRCVGFTLFCLRCVVHWSYEKKKVGGGDENEEEGSKFFYYTRHEKTFNKACTDFLVKLKARQNLEARRKKNTKTRLSHEDCSMMEMWLKGYISSRFKFENMNQILGHESLKMPDPKRKLTQTEMFIFNVILAEEALIYGITKVKNVDLDDLMKRFRVCDKRVLELCKAGYDFVSMLIAKFEAIEKTNLKVGDGKMSGDMEDDVCESKIDENQVETRNIDESDLIETQKSPEDEDDPGFPCIEESTKSSIEEEASESIPSQPKIPLEKKLKLDMIFLKQIFSLRLRLYSLRTSCLEAYMSEKSKILTQIKKLKQIRRAVTSITSFDDLEFNKENLSISIRQRIDLYKDQFTKLFKNGKFLGPEKLGKQMLNGIEELEELKVRLDKLPHVKLYQALVDLASEGSIKKDLDSREPNRRFEKDREMNTLAKPLPSPPASIQSEETAQIPKKEVDSTQYQSVTAVNENFEIDTSQNESHPVSAFIHQSKGTSNTEWIELLVYQEDRYENCLIGGLFCSTIETLNDITHRLASELDVIEWNEIPRLKLFRHNGITMVPIRPGQFQQPVFNLFKTVKHVLVFSLVS